MGKASRNKRREQKVIDHLRRLTSGLCLHCGLNPRHDTSVWCKVCSAKGSRVADARGMEIHRALARGEWPFDTSSYLAILEWLEANPEP